MTVHEHYRTETNLHTEHAPAGTNNTDWPNPWMETARSILDSVARAVFLTDSELNVLAWNARAERLAHSQAEVRIECGRLRPAGTSARQALDHATNQLLQSEDEANGATGVPVSRGWGRRPIWLLLNVHYAPSLVPSRNDLRLLRVDIIDTEAPTTICREWLTAVFSLTRREQDLACLLADGFSVQQAGACLGISVETARSHLKQVMAKTGSSRQPELVRTLMHCAY